MKQVEEQMQQSVDSLSTLLVEGVGGGKRGEEVIQREEESQSEQDDEKEPPVKSKIPPGAVHVLPSLSDQMSLLKPGSLGLVDVPRPTSPESLLEASLHSISLPLQPHPTHTQDESAGSKSAEKKQTSKRSGSASPSMTSLSQDYASSVLDSESADTARRPRSSSLDSTRHARCGQSSPGSKPLMIPSSQPPWMEMVSGYSVGG